jgi:hypothetical protein
VRAVFELDDGEVARIEEDFGAGVLRSRVLPISKPYPPGKMTFGVEVNEAVAVRHLTKNLVLPEGRGKTIRQLKTIAKLVEALDTIETPDPSVTELRQQIASWRAPRLALQLIDHYLSPWLPRFFYFDTYSVLNGKVSIPELRRRRDAKELEDADRTMLALLSMVGARLEDFHDAGNYERLKRELEAAANSITDQVFQYWTQNKQLSVALDIASPEAGAQPPLDQGPILHIRIHNLRHRVTVPFDERSRGFVWFFSFLAYFSELEDDEGARDVILLLDEPGLNLHATAQRDLLRFIDERLAPRHQVIYSTHSPFMIQADRLDRVRTVQDIDEEGTKVSAEVFRTDSETVFPLQAALGYDLAQTCSSAHTTSWSTAPPTSSTSSCSTRRWRPRPWPRWTPAGWWCRPAAPTRSPHSCRCWAATSSTWPCSWISAPTACSASRTCRPTPSSVPTRWC